MNKLSNLLAGIFAFFLLAWSGLVAVPFFQLGGLQPEVDADTGDVYPINAGGFAAQGKEVYIANGCINCHSQQVRPGHGGSDIARKWGNRQTVARDFLYDDPLLAGWSRVGQDLTNIGKRRPDAEWHLHHLWNPRMVEPDSIMPPFKFLFEKRKITGQRSDDALKLTGADAPPAGYEIVPTNEARALVWYLLSLDRTHALPESVIESKDEEEKPKDAEKPAAEPEKPAAAPEQPAAALSHGGANFAGIFSR